MNTQSPIELLPTVEKAIVIAVIETIRNKKGKFYAPSAQEIQKGIDAIELIKTTVAKANLPTSLCKRRPIGCPMQRNATAELQTLTKYEYHAAFLLGLFGNHGHSGTIVLNGKAN